MPEVAKRCPVCAGTTSKPFATVRDREFFTSSDRFEYRECPCGAVFLVDPPIDRLPEIYPPTYYAFEERSARRSLATAVKEWLDDREFRKLLAGVPGDALTALDVGGGSGWLLDRVRHASPRVSETHVVDPAESARAAAEAAGHAFHGVPIERFESEQHFHLILALNLIEHVADPRAVLSRLRDLLDDEGLALVKTPNTDTLDRRIFQHRDWGGFHCPRHWVLFTMPDFRRLAEDCGLEVVRASYTQGGVQWASSILQALGRAGWISTSAERPVFTHPLFLPVAMAAAAFDFLRRPFAPTAQMFFVLRRAT